MNLFEFVKGQAQPGWPVTHAPGGPPAVLVGEEGRGRTLVRLPLLQQDGSLAPSGPSKFCTGEGQQYTLLPQQDPYGAGARYGRCPNSHCTHQRWVNAGQEFLVPRHEIHPAPPTRTERVAHASLVRRGGTWGVQPCESGGTAVALLLRDQSGFRGGWKLIPADGCELPRKIAEGRCAQGDAGRAGGGPEYVLVLAEGEKVWVSRCGRLYGAPDEVRLRNVGGSIEVQTRAEVMEELANGAAVEEILS